MTLRSIGIFDSGIGGLTVMRAIRELLPTESLVYFGDTARVPYGPKSPDAILRYSLESGFFLKNLDVKALVVACHTATCIALEELQKQLDIPVLGVMAPSIEKAARLSKTGRIGVIGTRATITSGAYEAHLKARLPKAKIISAACPLFVPLVEEGYFNHPITDLAVHEALHPLKSQNIDVLLLACTHYPLLAASIQKELGEDVTLVDPGRDCAEALYSLLKENNLLFSKQKEPSYRFYVSDDPDKFRKHGTLYLNHPIESVCKKF